MYIQHSFSFVCISLGGNWTRVACVADERSSKELFEFGTPTSTTYNFLAQIASLIKIIYREIYTFYNPKIQFSFLNFILDYRQKDKEETETDKET